MYRLDDLSLCLLAITIVAGASQISACDKTNRPTTAVVGQVALSTSEAIAAFCAAWKRTNAVDERITFDDVCKANGEAHTYLDMFFRERLAKETARLAIKTAD